MQGLTEQVRVYEEMGDRRGSPAPPLMWTSGVTEDCIHSATENAFLVDLPEGEYRVYLAPAALYDYLGMLGWETNWRYLRCLIVH